MKSGDLKVAWSLAAPEQIFIEVLQNIAFLTEYAEHLFMAASDNLYQFCGFFLSFAKILRSQKQEMETLHNISIFYSNFWWWNISYRRVFKGLLRICCPIIREEINWYTSKIHSLHNRSYNPIIFPWYFQLDAEDEFCTSANNFWRWL